MREIYRRYANKYFLGQL